MAESLYLGKGNPVPKPNTLAHNGANEFVSTWLVDTRLDQTQLLLLTGGANVNVIFREDPRLEHGLRSTEAVR